VKFCHYSLENDNPRIAIEVNPGALVDLTVLLEHDNLSANGRPDSIDELLQTGRLRDIVDLAQQALGDRNDETMFLPPEVRIHPPVLHPPKIIGVGTNYQDHALEAGLEIAEEPVFFAKWSNALCGPFDPIFVPSVRAKVDWEVELVVVIGQMCFGVHATDAMKVVAGYTVGNDVSARDWQLRKPLGQWTLGKSFDAFLPVGPYLVTADEVEDPYALQLRCAVNGEMMQDAPAAMHFQIPELIAYLSQAVTLCPGDMILTGTPAGVGVARKPPVFLGDGDILTSEIVGLGQMSNVFRRREDVG
jgi:2-keto-4-pentenoate hydratase/2-oxohepta-3-ene-1,7-dioic acid hydratase in catechol pathway